MRHEVTIDVDAPADRVWQAISDVEKWSEWTPTVTEVRLHGGGELALGSVATLRQPKQPAREWTVTELVEGRSFTWTSAGLGLRFSAEHIVTDQNGTSVTLAFSMAGPLAPIAKLVAGKAIRWAVDTEAASLKKRCES